MLLFKQKLPLLDLIRQRKKAGLSVGFVPTMGALHAGHLSLIAAAAAQTDLVACSIFVNPTQFNDPRDFQKYPSTLERDVLQLSDAGVDVLFLPSVAEIYPEGTVGLPHYDLGYLETVLEGRYRPGHFQGVAQVVHKLLGAVQPDWLFLGQKDFQQCMIIRRLIELESLPVKLQICPTLREPDGLAMSSRNLRLSTDERERAPVIAQCLDFIAGNIYRLPFVSLKEETTGMLEAAGFRPDYVEIAGADDLRLLDSPLEKGKMAILIAARIGEIRLIDNRVI